MINLSIVHLNEDHIDEICKDIIEQQKSGVSTHAIFWMRFSPEYTPALNKAEQQCKIYDKMAAFFNLSFDVLEEIPFVTEKDIKRIEKLNPDGTRSECNFTRKGDTVYVAEELKTLMPVVLFIY